jgi:hypothetical protein
VSAPINTKCCPHCEKQFSPHPGETPANWARRKSCSRECANYAREWSPADPESFGMTKECAFCSGAMTRKPREQLAEWRRRRFCNPACASRDWARRQKETPFSRVAEDEDSDFAMSWEDIGEQLGITKEGARKIGERAMLKMRKACESYGIAPHAVFVSRENK